MVFQKYAFMNLEIAFRIGRCRFVLEIAFHFGDRFGTYGHHKRDVTYIVFSVYVGLFARLSLDINYKGV